MSAPPFGSAEWWKDFRAFLERERLRRLQAPPPEIDFWVANQQQREYLERVFLAYYQKTYGPSVKSVTVEEIQT